MSRPLAGAARATATSSIRPLDKSDQEAWRRARHRNAAWLVPWDATVPPGGDARPDLVPPAGEAARPAGPDGSTLPFAIEVGGRFAGQVTVNNIVRGLGAVRLHRLLARQGVRRARGHAACGRHGRSTTASPTACTASRSRSVPRTRTRCAWWRSSASARSATRPGSCTSTATGATTGSTRSPARSAPADCSPGCD